MNTRHDDPATHPGRIARARALAAAGLATAVLALGGCAAPGQVPPGGEAQLVEDLKAGRVQLDCGLACAPLYLFNEAQILQLMRSNNWQGLGLTVAKTGWRHDITYYQLGLAAEGLGAPEAADRYYRMAGALATGANNADKCSSVQNLCKGLVFPRDIQTRLRALAPVLAAHNGGGAPAQRAAASGGASPPAPQPAPAAPEFIADAPQTLLALYASQRLRGSGSGNERRDRDFGNALLEVMDPAAAADTRNNEIARPRAIAALKERLGTPPVEQRVVVGLWVQLREYDAATHAFPLRYPAHVRSGPLALGGGVFNGSSQRSAGARGYTAQGSGCVWEPGNEYAAPEGQDLYFVLLSVCLQHPVPNQRVAGLNHNGNEVPPTFFLMPPRDALWSRLPVDEARAEALIRRAGGQRLLWAELVLDVRALGPLQTGPFTMADVIEQKRPGMAVAVQPRALVVWEQPPEPGRTGRVAAVMGDAPAEGLGSTLRLARNLVPDRSYEDVPLAEDWASTQRVAVRPATVPVPVAAEKTRTVAAPRPAAPPPSRPVAAAKPSKPPVDNDEAWVEPPPARR